MYDYLCCYSYYFEIPGNVDLFKIPSNVVIDVLLSGTGLICFAYYGFENIVNISEETKSPTRIIPLAVLLSIVITTVVYVGVALAVTSYDTILNAKSSTILPGGSSFPIDVISALIV